MNITRTLRAVLIAGSLAATGAFAAEVPGDFARLSSQYAGWAGGKTNSDALVAGMRSGSSITLVTTGSGRSVSLAGFTPSAPMTYGQISSALAGARQTLARLGIANPNAEQIQAALIGGEVMTSKGETVALRGSVNARGGTGPVASR